ncbi:hypothetical protein TBR22_A29510 [Luteitalea sp. TBR-22]|uniref:hypothetical protein n=1 Tax=Luteitalea sp. TBR-22 TaxID=2802971 RepID=UPI001AF72850|nr:hypothetical protein [Luteitalea sp. TBR-22]BCS33724.1 hypothetical protein TBR22_A29510 [Luteitalea sp. TBR-22]
MPLIRLARDKRGLDTLYLLHQRPDGRGETRLRVLYFCAMPQGQSFGRGPLDPGTQRALEQRYPDVSFDWPALLKEIEQRRLPPPIEPQARRGRPPGKAERRPPASEPPADKAAAGKRKRRRGGQGGAQERAAGDRPDTPGATAAPIIE